MSERSVASLARTTSPLSSDKELLADAVEEALARLRAARPHLESRLDRAATIVVVHLSSAARTRPIKVRVRKNGSPVFLVASLTSGGAIYEVNPADWSCACPDFHRRGSACKHAWTHGYSHRQPPPRTSWEAGRDGPALSLGPGGGHARGTFGPRRVLRRPPCAAPPPRRRRLGEEIPACDAQENGRSLKQGWRVLSSYPLKEDGRKVWIITEADKTSTCLLLPEEY